MLFKKVTLELIYQVVDERTEELKNEIKDLKKRQEEDFRFLVQKIDTEIGQLNQRIDKIKSPDAVRLRGILITNSNNQKSLFET